MSIKVTGTGQGLSRTTNLPNHNSAYTMMTWVNMTSVTGASGTYRCLFDVDAGTNLGDILYMTGDGSIASLWVNNSTNFNGVTTINTTNWYHVAMVRETNARLLMYINGKFEVVNTTSVAGRAATSNMGIAQALSTSSGEDLQSAQFEEIRIWRQALTQNEIAAEMRSTQPVKRAGLISYTLAQTTDEVQDYAVGGRWTVTGTLSRGVAINAALNWPRRQRVLNVASSGAMTGSIALSITPTGALTGAGALAGTVPLTITPSGALTGAGALIGAVPLSLAVSGAMTGAGALVGSVPLTFAPVGALTGAGALTGVATVTLAVSGTLTDAAAGGAITGAVPMVFTIVGALTGSGALAGAVQIDFTPVGVLTNATPVTDAPSGGFFYDVDSYRAHKRRQRRELEELERERSQSDLPQVEREIAELLSRQERLDAERTERERIQTIADRYSSHGRQLGLPNRVRASLIKAYEERTRNSLEQLEREINRMQEEEELAVLQILLNDD